MNEIGFIVLAGAALPFLFAFHLAERQHKAWVAPPPLRTAFYFIRSALTGFTTNDFLSRNRVSPKEAFEGLELA